MDKTERSLLVGTGAAIVTYVIASLIPQRKSIGSAVKVGGSVGVGAVAAAIAYTVYPSQQYPQ